MPAKKKIMHAKKDSKVGKVAAYSIARFLVMSDDLEWVSEARDSHHANELVCEMIANDVPENAILVYEVSHVYSVKAKPRIEMFPRKV